MIYCREGAGNEISGRPDRKKNCLEGKIMGDTQSHKTLPRTTDAELDCSFVKDALHLHSKIVSPGLGSWGLSRQLTKIPE